MMSERQRGRVVELGGEYCGYITEEPRRFLHKLYFFETYPILTFQAVFCIVAAPATLVTSQICNLSRVSNTLNILESTSLWENLMPLVPLRGLRLSGLRFSTHRRSPSIFSRVSQPSVNIGYGSSSCWRMKSTFAHNDSLVPKSGLASDSDRQKAAVAYIAFGSNVGDRLHMIEDAIKSLDAENDITVLRTSGVWETKAMYVVDQDNFLNGVCEVGQVPKGLR